MPKLTIVKANEIGGALAELAELNKKSIIETTDAAKRRGLQAYLEREATENLPELLACWFTMQNQYRPLIQGFACLIANASAAIGKSEEAPPQPAEPTRESRGDNMVPSDASVARANAATEVEAKS